MKCKHCKKDLEKKDYTYCPYCGQQARSKKFYELGIKDLVEGALSTVETILMKELMETMEESIMEQKAVQKGPFRVKVITSQNPAHPPRNTKKSPISDLQKENTRPIPKETIEPAVDITRVENKMIVEIDLPEISSMKDIDIHKLDNSCEIRAYSKDKLYMKILNIPHDMALAQKAIENETLILEFSK